MILFQICTIWTTLVSCALVFWISARRGTAGRIRGAIYLLVIVLAAAPICFMAGLMVWITVIVYNSASTNAFSPIEPHQKPHDVLVESETNTRICFNLTSIEAFVAKAWQNVHSLFRFCPLSAQLQLAEPSGLSSPLSAKDLAHLVVSPLWGASCYVLVSYILVLVTFLATRYFSGTSRTNEHPPVLKASDSCVSGPIKMVSESSTCPEYTESLSKVDGRNLKESLLSHSECVKHVPAQGTDKVAQTDWAPLQKPETDKTEKPEASLTWNTLQRSGSDRSGVMEQSPAQDAASGPNMGCTTWNLQLHLAKSNRGEVVQPMAPNCNTKPRPSSLPPLSVAKMKPTRTSSLVSQKRTRGRLLSEVVWSETSKKHPRSGSENNSGTVPSLTDDRRIANKDLSEKTQRQNTPPLPTQRNENHTIELPPISVSHMEPTTPSLSTQSSLESRTIELPSISVSHMEPIETSTPALQKRTRGKLLSEIDHLEASKKRAKISPRDMTSAGMDSIQDRDATNNKLSFDVLEEVPNSPSLEQGLASERGVNHSDAMSKGEPFFSMDDRQKRWYPCRPYRALSTFDMKQSVPKDGNRPSNDAHGWINLSGRRNSSCPGTYHSPTG